MTALERLPSRLKGPQKILTQLRVLKDRAYRIRVRNDRAVHRATSPDEAHWCARVGDRLDEYTGALDRLIREGEAVLPPSRDPRDHRRVRKSKG